MSEQEYPLWQKIDIFLSEEYDKKDVHFQQDNDKGEYMRDPENRARAEKELTE